jgi:hypothetical protein
MAYGQQQVFAHRVNEDGTFDSICRRCYRTAVRAEPQKMLGLHERLHVCDGKKLPSRIENLILALQIASKDANAVEVTDERYASRLAGIRIIIRELQEALIARDWLSVNNQRRS